MSIYANLVNFVFVRRCLYPRIRWWRFECSRPLPNRPIKQQQEVDSYVYLHNSFKLWGWFNNLCGTIQWNTFIFNGTIAFIHSLFYYKYFTWLLSALLKYCVLFYAINIIVSQQVYYLESVLPDLVEFHKFGVFWCLIVGKICVW